MIARINMPRARKPLTDFVIFVLAKCFWGGGARSLKFIERSCFEKASFCTVKIHESTYCRSSPTCSHFHCMRPTYCSFGFVIAPQLRKFQRLLCL